MTRVLLVEDDRDIAEPLARALGREGYDVSEAGDGRVALEGVLAAPPDLIILDIGLPGIDGLEVCRHVRDLHPQLPILMLTARDGELETVAGLDAGADDYVTKPFRLSVLLARVRAMLRRSAPAPSVVGDVSLDESSRRAWRGDELELSPKEFALLALLMREAGRVLTRERIMSEVWDTNWFGSTKTLDMHMVVAAPQARRAAGASPRSAGSGSASSADAPSADRHHVADRAGRHPRAGHPARHRRGARRAATR